MTSVVVEHQRTWRPHWPCVPYDILRPLRRGGQDPAFQREPGGAIWRATTTPDGPATMRIERRPALAVIALTAWGPGANWMLGHAPELLGASDDVGDFQPSHPRARAAWLSNPYWRVTRSGLVLEAMVGAVIEQKVTGQEAWIGWRRLLTRFGPVAPGPGTARGMHCVPAPETLEHVPSWEWLRCHIDPARSSTIVRAARVAPALERTLALTSEQTDRALQSLPGVGRWTSAEVRQRAHGDPDAVSFGDYHIAAHVGWALTGEEVDDQGLGELLEADRPHRYRTQYVVTTRLPGRPRHGPRMAPRRHLPR